MKLSGFGVLLTMTFSDKMDIYRRGSVENNDGTTGVNIPGPVFENIKCRISFKNSDYPESDLEDSNPINMNIKIFCGPDVDVKKGDKLIIKRLNESGGIMKSYIGIANLPFTFVTHQEIEIVEVGDA